MGAAEARPPPSLVELDVRTAGTCSGMAYACDDGPGFLQGAAEVEGHKFLCQLDFDDIDVSQAWPDAGLMGFIYVFVREDEKSGLAFWQYT